MTFRNGYESEEEEDDNEVTDIKAAFEDSWPRLVKETLEVSKFAGIPKGLKWLEEVMDKNVPGGKRTRGVVQVYFYRQLVEDRTEEQDYHSCVLGWCIEILQAAALIADDIMDGALTRRGEPCWYLREGVYLAAVNDVLMLENVVYQILRKYFGSSERYVPLMDLFHETTFQSILGQALDTKLGMEGSVETFDVKEYQTMVEYKTGYYSFYLPVAVAMTHAGIRDHALFESVQHITLRMGCLFQVQDDYLDCYGDPDRTGKIGTDIIDGKCTWLVVKAMEAASPNQKDEIKKLYGRKTKEDEQRVRAIFEDLGVSQMYFDYEMREYKDISKLISILPEDIPQEPLNHLIDAIYQRDK